jgi:uncharacterized radical SAM superfamily Fe-S cluster-containing enzyme
MDCPICLKDKEKIVNLSTSDFTNILDCLYKYEGSLQVINISGGEPTLHPEIGEFLKISNERESLQVSISTNGNQLLVDDELVKNIKDSDSIVSLQFDGFNSETSLFLRGVDVIERKLQIVEFLEKEDIKYSLVSAIVKGVNDKEITDIVDYFFESRALSLMFQPITFTGNAIEILQEDRRITIPDIVEEIEKSRFTSPGDFNPLPCAHFSCFALAYYFYIEGEEYLTLKDFLGITDYLDVISNRTLPGLDYEGFSLLKDKVYDFWSAADASNANERILFRLREILKIMNETAFSEKRAFKIGTESMKSIFIHHMMDIDTLDFGRLVKCCNHYPQADGRLVPMCAYNVFEQ